MTDDDAGAHGYQRDIRDAWKDALAEIAELERRQNPSGEARHQAATALNTFRKTLRPHADDNALETDWGERGVDVISDWVHGTTTIERECPGLTSATRVTKVPLSHAVPVRDFDAVFEELQRIAKELGFSAESKRSREQFHIASPDEDDHPEPVSDNVTKPGQTR